MIRRRPKIRIDERKKEQGELMETIKVLQKCKSSNNAELRSGITGLIKKFRVDYNRLVSAQIQEKIEKEDEK